METRAAHKLGIHSRDSFVKKTSIAVLTKYREDYQALAKLFELEDERIKNAKLSDL